MRNVGIGDILKGAVVTEHAVAEDHDRRRWEGQEEAEWVQDPEVNSSSAADVDVLSPDEWSQLLRDDGPTYSNAEVQLIPLATSA